MNYKSQNRPQQSKNHYEIALKLPSYLNAVSLLLIYTASCIAERNSFDKF